MDSDNAHRAKNGAAPSNIIMKAARIGVLELVIFAVIAVSSVLRILLIGGDNVFGFGCNVIWTGCGIITTVQMLLGCKNGNAQIVRFHIIFLVVSIVYTLICVFVALFASVVESEIAMKWLGLYVKSHQCTYHEAHEYFEYPHWNCIGVEKFKGIWTLLVAVAYFVFGALQIWFLLTIHQCFAHLRSKAYYAVAPEANAMLVGQFEILIFSLIASNTALRIIGYGFDDFNHDHWTGFSSGYGFTFTSNVVWVSFAVVTTILLFIGCKRGRSSMILLHLIFLVISFVFTLLHITLFLVTIVLRGYVFDQHVVEWTEISFGIYYECPIHPDFRRHESYVRKCYTKTDYVDHVGWRLLLLVLFGMFAVAQYWFIRVVGRCYIHVRDEQGRAALEKNPFQMKMQTMTPTAKQNDFQILSFNSPIPATIQRGILSRFSKVSSANKILLPKDDCDGESNDYENENLNRGQLPPSLNLSLEDKETDRTMETGKLEKDKVRFENIA